MSRISIGSLAAVLAITAGACHHPKPAELAPVHAPNADSIAAANARRDAAARADAARRDSISRADAARRDAAAREEAQRRAEAEAANALATMQARVYFDFDKDDLRADAMAALDAKLPLLKARPAVRIRIEGSTDERGSDTYNLALGQRRAAIAKRYLVARGISEARIDVVSFGEDRPTCHDSSEPCWQQNRRDEFVIVAGTMAVAVGR